LATSIYAYFPETLQTGWASLSQVELTTLLQQTIAERNIVQLSLVNITFALPYGLDPNLFGLTASLIVYVSFTYLYPNKNSTTTWQKKTASSTTSIPPKTIKA
jgi:solute:Na+ symporter, SSS family